MLEESKVSSFKPSATILSLTFIFNFKKDLLSCSMAMFKRMPFKKEMPSKSSLNSSNLSPGIDS